MQNLWAPLAVLSAYAIGSLSFAVIVSKLMGLSDPRTYGSGNPGATNVLRSGNKAAAVLTLLLDASKGFVPVLLVKLYGPAYGLEEGTLALVAIAAFTRYSSLAALVAAVFAPFYQVLIWGGGPIASAVFVMGALLIWRHRA